MWKGDSHRAGRSRGGVPGWHRSLTWFCGVQGHVAAGRALMRRLSGVSRTTVRCHGDHKRHKDSEWERLTPEVRGWGQWRGRRHSPHLAKRKTDQCVGRGGGVGGVEYIKNIMLVSEHACSCGKDRKDSIVNDLKSSSFKPGGHLYLVQRKPRVCCPVEYKSPLASRTPILCILS